MIKKISIILSLLFGLIILISVYLSTVGIQTSSFNSIIKNKVRNFNEDINLKFTKAKLLLDIKSLSFKVRLLKPTIESNKSEINFHNINSIISIKSFLNNEFALKKIKFKTKKTEIKELVKFIRSTYPSPFAFFAKNLIEKGTIHIETEIFFNKKGELIENYEVKGSIINLETKITNKHRLLGVNSNFKIKKNLYQFDIKKFSFYDIQFDSTNLNIKKKEKDLIFSIVSKNSGKIESIEKLLNNFDYKLQNNNINFLNLSFDLKNEINFKIKKLTKFKDFNVKGSGKIHNLLFSSSLFEKFKEYIEIKKNVEFQKNEITYNYINNNFDLESSGEVNFSEEFNDYKFYFKHDKKNNLKIVNTHLDLKNILINLKNLEYNKPIKKKSDIKIEAIFGKETLIKKLDYNESKNIIKIKNLKLNEQNQILDFKEIFIKTSKNNVLNNDLNITKKNNKINISGKKYDATFFLKNLTEEKNSKIFSEKFKGKLDVNIDEITNETETIYNFSSKGEINFGKIDRLNAKGNFSKNEFLDISIIPLNSGKKKMYVYSERAKPFVENFDFIKGFTEGKLIYNSTYDEKSSISNLKIYDFKVQNVPVLAKLLSLASLQGIADVLTGEGIRFNMFEMDFKSKEKLMTFDEIYALGPAISILMEGYIEKKRLVSLRGTLVPATTLNKVIGSIPILGKILVGKKTGEGVFGVSFKIKGHPKNLKTSVNPIKTLTPRFITRTLEKIKKN